jgi:hypothetical protein
VEVLGIEHVDLTVNDLARSAAFYSFVLEALGFKRFGHPAEHASWSNGKFSITLRPAAPELAGVSTRPRSIPSMEPATTPFSSPIPTV